ncbi:hypothetical protein PV325_006638 [Microctonus aethiopoides]|nr:hypothetical protein PV325_006638 [Microctonus aethiopoides]
MLQGGTEQAALAEEVKKRRRKRKQRRGRRGRQRRQRQRRWLQSRGEENLRRCCTTTTTTTTTTTGTLWKGLFATQAHQEGGGAVQSGRKRRHRGVVASAESDYVVRLRAKDREASSVKGQIRPDTREPTTSQPL